MFCRTSPPCFWRQACQQSANIHGTYRHHPSPTIHICPGLCYDKIACCVNIARKHTLRMKQGTPSCIEHRRSPWQHLSFSTGQGCCDLGLGRDVTWIMGRDGKGWGGDKEDRQSLSISITLHCNDRKNIIIELRIISCEVDDIVSRAGNCILA